MRAPLFDHLGGCTAAALIAACAAHAPVALAAPRGARPAQPAPAAAAAQEPAPATQGYVYNPEGRRDPFVSLLRRGNELAQAASARPEGVPGLLVGDVALKGIVLSRGTYVAMIQAPDSKTYSIRTGDRLFDASVKAITADAVVFVQQVNDPLSVVRQREIRRPLRPTEEGK